MVGLVKVFLLFAMALAFYTYAGVIADALLVGALVMFCLMAVLMVVAMVLVAKWWFGSLTSITGSAPAELGPANSGLYSEEGSWTSVG